MNTETKHEPSRLDWVCPKCGSDQVHAQMWVDANTDEILGEAGSYYWCASCEESDGDGELKHLCQRYEYTPKETQT